MLRHVSLLACLLGAVSPGYASTFSYTTFDVGLGRATLDDKVRVVNEVYEDFAAFRIGGGYQFSENFALSLNASGLVNEGDDSEITMTTVEAGGLLPFAVSERADIVPRVGYISGEAEVCYDSLCSTADDSGLIYGIGVRAWAAPDLFEVNAAYTDNTMDGDNKVIAAGAALWFQNHHSIRLDYADATGMTTITLGYRFTW